MAKGLPRVLVVCAAGGHLQDALLATAGGPMERVLATFALPHLREQAGTEHIRFLIDPHTSLGKDVVNALQSLWLMLRVRPQVVLSTGAGIAVPCALIGKAMGAKLVFIELAASVHDLSRTCRFLCHCHQSPDLGLLRSA